MFVLKNVKDEEAKGPIEYMRKDFIHP